MQKTILIVFFFCFCYLTGGIATAGESKSEEYGLTVTTSDRWTHTVHTGPDYYVLFINDARDQANGYFSVVRAGASEHKGFTSAWDRAEKKLIPGSVKSYVENQPFLEGENTKTKVILGDGTEAQALHKELTINGHRRSMFFFTWEREVRGEKIWYFARFMNTGWYYKLEGSVVAKEILASIK